MAIHDKRPRIWTEREVDLLSEVTERSWAHIERVRAEQAARASDERLRLATDAASIGTWDFNPVTGQLRWKDQSAKRYSVSLAKQKSPTTHSSAGYILMIVFARTRPSRMRCRALMDRRASRSSIGLLLQTEPNAGWRPQATQFLKATLQFGLSAWSLT